MKKTTSVTVHVNHSGKPGIQIVAINTSENYEVSGETPEQVVAQLKEVIEALPDGAAAA